MDPLRFRKRRLFRREALDLFVGTFGDASTPELLTPFPVRAMGWGIGLALGSLFFWSLLGSLPMRVTVTGHLEAGGVDRPRLAGWVRQGDATRIQAGQPIHISIHADSMRTIAARVVSLPGPGSKHCGDADPSPAEVVRGQVRILMALDRRLPVESGASFQALSGLPVTAWVTVGHQPPWLALLAWLGMTPKLVHRGGNDSSFEIEAVSLL